MRLWLKGNITIPPKPRTVGGLVVWARGVNRALAELRDRKIVGGVAPGRGGGASPLKLTLKQGTEADKLQVIPGTVNGEMPTLAGTALDATVGDPALPPEITVAVDTWVWIKCVGTFGDPDTYVVTIVTETTDAPPAGTAISATGFTSFENIGYITVDTAPDPDAYEITNVHGGGNLGVDSWGLYNHWWRA